MSGSLKRGREESSFAVHPLCEYQLRKEYQGTRNVASLSTTINNYDDEDDRVHSPNSIIEAHTMFIPHTRESKRTLSFASKRDDNAGNENDPEAERRVTIWNWREQRKLSGNSAPFKKNLKDYIRKHPDWEEYVGQDKDAITGKKLALKKMAPPAPHDRDHPWYTMQRTGAMPPIPPVVSPHMAAPHMSTYGTRSTQSRLLEIDGTRQSSRASQPHVEGELETVKAVFNPELCEPMRIKLESPAEVSYRRSLEMEARRQAMAAEVDASSDERDTKKVQAAREAEQEAEKAAWRAASEQVARLRAEKEAADRHIAEERLSQRRSAHAAVQRGVASSAMARIEAFKNKRRMIAV